MHLSLRFPSNKPPLPTWAWYFKSFLILPVVKFHTSMKPSALPVTRYWPSGENEAHSGYDLLANLIVLLSSVGYFSSSRSLTAARPLDGGREESYLSLSLSPLHSLSLPLPPFFLTWTSRWWYQEGEVPGVAATWGSVPGEPSDAMEGQQTQLQRVTEQWPSFSSLCCFPQDRPTMETHHHVRRWY